MKTQILLPLSLTFSHAAAQISTDIVGMGSGPGPVQNASLFESANQNPNATGSVELSAFDTRTEPNVFRPVPWTASINVTEVPWTSNTSITNSVLSLYAYSGYFQETDIWGVCMVILKDVAINATVKGQDDDGSCKMAFGEDCVGNISSVLSSAGIDAMRRNDTNPCGGVSRFIMPKECQGSFSGSTVAIPISPNDTDREAWLYETSQEHDASNFTFYETAVTRLWPMVLVQSNSGPERGPNDPRAVSANVNCLRAANVTDGSRDVDDVPGAAARVKFGVWGLLSALVIAALMM